MMLILNKYVIRHSYRCTQLHSGCLTVLHDKTDYILFKITDTLIGNTLFHYQIGN